MTLTQAINFIPITMLVLAFFAFLVRRMLSLAINDVYRDMSKLIPIIADLKNRIKELEAKQ